MLGSEFVRNYAPKGLHAWEAAAFELARQDAVSGQFSSLTPWPWVDLVLSDGVNHAILKVQLDVLSIGPTEDYVRLPLTPSKAQDIFNLFGWVLPTPWLVYQIWRNSPNKLEPTPLPNKGADLLQYAVHSSVIDQQLEKQTGARVPSQGVSGHKKHVVVSNIYQPGKVLIFGFYHPAPDVWPSNGIPYPSPARQPIQPDSNVHGDFYVDYSHGIQAIGPVAIVNGQAMDMVELYQHPTFSKLVSKEGPIRVPRYPSRVTPAVGRPVHSTQFPTNDVVIATTTPNPADVVLNQFRK